MSEPPRKKPSLLLAFEPDGEEKNENDGDNADWANLTTVLWGLVCEFDPLGIALFGTCRTLRRKRTALWQPKLLLDQLFADLRGCGIDPEKLGKALQEDQAVLSGSFLLASLLKAVRSPDVFKPVTLDIFARERFDVWSGKKMATDERKAFIACFTDDKKPGHHQDWNTDVYPFSCSQIRVISPGGVKQPGVRFITTTIRDVHKKFSLGALCSAWDGKHLIVQFPNDVALRRLQVSDKHCNLRSDKLKKLVKKYIERKFIPCSELKESVFLRWAGIEPPFKKHDCDDSDCTNELSDSDDE